MKLGDVVIYTSIEGHERAAIVTRVVDDETVNLQVIPDGEDDADNDKEGKEAHAQALDAVSARMGRGEADVERLPQRIATPVVTGFVSGTQLIWVPSVKRNDKGEPGTWRT